MEVTQNMGNYAKTLLAMLKGDASEVLALHNERRAKSSIKKQISNLEDRQTTLQEKLEDAEEKLKETKYPTYKLQEESSYCAKVLAAQRVVDSAKEELDDCLASIKYFEELRKELSL